MKKVIIRDQYWDSLKFILINFIVLEHTIALNAPNGSFNCTLHNLIPTFALPLFVFVSGRFSHIKDREKYKKGILKIVETYLFFQFIWQLIHLACGKDLNWNFFIRFFISPSWTLWYLVSIVWWRILILLLSEEVLKERPFMILASSFLISILGGLIPFNACFSLQRTMAYIPFFFMGYYSTNLDVRAYVKNVPIFMPFIVFAVMFLFFYFCLNFNLSYVMQCKVSYWSMPEMSIVQKILSRCSLLFLATLMSLMVMRIVPRNQIIAKYGTITLFFYMYHTFLVKLFQFGEKYGFIPKSEWILIIYAFLIMIILILLSRCKFFNLILNPVSNYIYRKGFK